MTTALFIDDAYLKEYSPVGKSVDVELLFPFVMNAQDIYSQDILGTPLYNDFVSKITNNTPLTQIEWQLMDLVSRALVYWTVYSALPHIMLRMRNAGVVKTNAENTTNSDLTEMKYLREEMKNLAEFYNQRIVNFLCDNSNLFPLYDAVSKDIYPSNTQYDSDIYIEPRIRDYTYEELRLLKKYLG
jgi:hypothetical protein